MLSSVLLMLLCRQQGKDKERQARVEWVVVVAVI